MKRNAVFWETLFWIMSMFYLKPFAYILVHTTVFLSMILIVILM